MVSEIIRPIPEPPEPKAPPPTTEAPQLRYRPAARDRPINPAGRRQRQDDRAPTAIQGASTRRAQIPAEIAPVDEERFALRAVGWGWGHVFSASEDTVRILRIGRETPNTERAQVKNQSPRAMGVERLHFADRGSGAPRRICLR